MSKKLFNIFFLVSFCILIFSCKNDVIPKPSGYLSLEYAKPDYLHFENSCPFTFDINSNSIIKEIKNCNFEITYPKMKATLYLTYKPVANNLKDLLRDAQKRTYEHVVKADDIIEQPFNNSSDKVFGMFYQVDGNAATNSQFYVTDSTKHFVACSVYFYAKPNFDSIMPAVNYIKSDMRVLMESLRWKK
jgi:gliding motility-associated lipoprotein GldD